MSKIGSLHPEELVYYLHKQRNTEKVTAVIQWLQFPNDLILQIFHGKFSTRQPPLNPLASRSFKTMCVPYLNEC